MLAVFLCNAGFFRAHQTHYEQFGKLTGTVNIAEYGQVELNVTGMRDHSYGMFSIKALSCW